MLALFDAQGHVRTDDDMEASANDNNAFARRDAFAATEAVVRS